MTEEQASMELSSFSQKEDKDLHINILSNVSIGTIKFILNLLKYFFERKIVV